VLSPQGELGTLGGVLPSGSEWLPIAAAKGSAALTWPPIPGVQMSMEGTRMWKGCGEVGDTW
jgi:hypothetical protein